MKKRCFFPFGHEQMHILKRFDLQTQISFHNSPTLHVPTKANETRNIYAFITNIQKKPHQQQPWKQTSNTHNQLKFVHFIHLFAQIAVHIFLSVQNCMLIFSTPLDHLALARECRSVRDWFETRAHRQSLCTKWEKRWMIATECCCCHCCPVP